MKTKSQMTLCVAAIFGICVSTLIQCSSANAFAVFQDPFSETRHYSLLRFPDEFLKEELHKKLTAESLAIQKEKTLSAESMSCRDISDVCLKAFDVRRAKAWSARNLSLHVMSCEHTMAPVLADVASAAFLEGQLDLAEKFSVRAAQMEKNGRSDVTGITAHLQRAALLRATGKLAEAEASIRYALQKVSKGDRCQDLCADDLVSTLVAAKRFDEAADALLQKKKVVLFGDVDSNQIRVASIRLQQGKYEECIRITEEQEKIVIDGRYDFGRVAAGLQHLRGMALLASNKKTEARTEFQKSVKNYLQSCGHGSYYLLAPLEQLCKLEESASTTRAFATAENDAGRSNGSDDESDQQSFDRASELLFSGKLKAAANQIKVTLAQSKKRWGENHPYTADVLVLSGTCNFLQGALEQAAVDYSKALSITEKAFSKNDIDVMNILELLARVDLERNPTRAVSSLERAITVAKKVTPLAPSRIASTYELLGDAYLRLGATTKAATAYSWSKTLLANNTQTCRPWLDVQRIQSKLESIVPKRLVESDAPPLPQSPAQGHVYFYKLVSDWDESDDWKYAGELEGFSADSIQRGMLQRAPDIVPLFTPAFRLPSSIKKLDLSGARISVVRAWLSAPGAPSTVESINLSGAQLDQLLLGQLNKFSVLKELNLADAELQGGIGPLAMLSSLESIDLTGQTIGGRDIAEISRLPKLIKLNLSYCIVPFADLAKLTQIQNLTLVGSNAADMDVAVISHLPKLKELDISCTEIGDASVNLLANMRLLEKINVGSTKFSDAGQKKLWDLGSKNRLHDMGG